MDVPGGQVAEANLLCHGLRREAQRHAALARSHRINPPQCAASPKRRRRFALPAQSKMTGSPHPLLIAPGWRRAGERGCETKFCEVLRLLGKSQRFLPRTLAIAISRISGRRLQR